MTLTNTQSLLLLLLLDDSNADASLLSGTLTSRPGLHLLFQLVSWSASRLHHLEGLATSLIRHLPPSLLHHLNTTGGEKREQGENKVDGEDKKTTEFPSLDKVLRCLVQLPVCPVAFYAISN